MSEPNWGNLMRTGRAKAIGVPWNAEEAHAALNLRIPADYVRAGVLTQEAYEKALKSGKAPVTDGPVLRKARKVKAEPKVGAAPKRGRKTKGVEEN